MREEWGPVLSPTTRVFHVSYDQIRNFTLRVPHHRLYGEDNITGRICVATSVENCINAKAGQASALELAVGNKLPLALFVYEAEVNRNDLIFPCVLQRDYGVSDAIMNQEYWLMKVPEFTERICFVNDAHFSYERNADTPKVSDIQLTEYSRLPSWSIQAHFQRTLKDEFSEYTTDEILMDLLEDMSCEESKQFLAKLRRDTYERILHSDEIK